MGASAAQTNLQSVMSSELDDVSSLSDEELGDELRRLQVDIAIFFG